MEQAKNTYIGAMMDAGRQVLAVPLATGRVDTRMQDFVASVEAAAAAPGVDLAALRLEMLAAIDTLDPAQNSAALQAFRQGLLRREQGARVVQNGPLRIVRALLDAHLAAVLAPADAAAALQRRLSQLFAVPPEDQRLRGLVSALEQLVRQVPQQLEQLAAAADEAGVGAQLAPLLEQAAGYLLHPDDQLADHHGLLGLLDDLYLMQQFLQGINARYLSLTGRELLPAPSESMTEILDFILGGDITAVLEGVRVQAVNQCVQQSYFQQLAQWRGSLPGDDSAGTDTRIEIERLLAELGSALS